VVATVAANLMYLQDVGGTPGRIADALALSGVALVGIAAGFPVRPLRDARDRGILVPVAFGAVALAVTALAVPLGLSGVAIGAAVAALALTLARTALVLREHSRMLAESRLEAGTDALTGLPNRRPLGRDLDAALAAGDPHVLVLLDLNGFKGFNDAFGHNAGDDLLALLGGRLADAVRGQGTAYRLGGDEFCVLARCAGTDGAEDVARRCVAAMRHSFEDVDVSAAHGSVVLPGRHPDGAGALAAADALMYREKRRRAAVRVG
jgi:diguanylate cyclase (GGDEF)-like protein